MKRRAIFLDRDGVINKASFANGKHRSPMAPEEVELYKDAKRSIRKLRKLGFLIFVVTNQPEISRGNLRIEDSDAINAIIGKEIEPDEIVVCPHDDSDGCICRKPLPGMITGIISRYTLEPSRCYLVGDRVKDIEAGIAAGVECIQIDRGYPEGLSTAEKSSSKSLAGAVRIISKMERRGF